VECWIAARSYPVARPVIRLQCRAPSNVACARERGQVHFSMRLVRRTGNWVPDPSLLPCLSAHMGDSLRRRPAGTAEGPMKSFTRGATVVAAILLAGTSHALVVNTCGQSVSGGAELTADLDCTGHTGHAVVVEDGTFDLQGFTLTGGDLDAVHCPASCTIVSTGAQGLIRDAAGYGIRALGKMLSVSNVSVQNNYVGIHGGSNTETVSMTVVDSSATGNESGIVCQAESGKLRIERTTSSANASTGVLSSTCKISLRESILDGNGGDGLSGRYVQVRDSTITGNTRRGINWSQLLCTQFEPCPKRMRVYGSTISANGMEGIRAQLGIYLVDSEVSGNGGGGVLNDGDLGEDKPDHPPIYHCSSTIIRNSQIHDNTGFGIQSGGRSIKVSDSQVYLNSGEGIAGRSMCRGKLSVSDSTVTDNGLHGLVMNEEDSTTRASGVTATGNGTDASCGVSQVCADVATIVEPTVVGSTCETSYVLDSGMPGSSWSVCSLD
jgi:hypothetical protein